MEEAARDRESHAQDDPGDQEKNGNDAKSLCLAVTTLFDVTSLSVLFHRNAK